MDYSDDIAAQDRAVDTFRSFLRENRDLLRLVAHWGDGHGAYLLGILQEELGIAPSAPAPGYRKQAIPRALAKQVFERDAYRCLDCGTHLDLCCDHVLPESKGGPTTLDNLATRCRSCNSRKGVR